VLSLEGQEAFRQYAPFGLTYDSDNVFRYQGKTVRWFADREEGTAFTRRVENDYEKSVDLTALRDAQGNLTGVSPATQEEFERRTAQIVQADKEREVLGITWDGAYEYVLPKGGADEPITVYITEDRSAVSVAQPNSGSAASTEAVQDAGGGAVSYRATMGDGEASDGAYATSDAPDYADDSLAEYAAYGVYYDRAAREWMFGGKPVSALVDTHRVYISGTYTEGQAVAALVEQAKASGGVLLKVVRNVNGSIDKVAEMTVGEAITTLSDRLEIK
jgi:hypothetical protein